MKKVLIFPKFGKFGGTRTYFQNLIIFYHSNGYSIVAILDKNQCDNEILEFLTKKDVKDPIAIKKQSNQCLITIPFEHP